MTTERRASAVDLDLASPTSAERQPTVRRLTPYLGAEVSGVDLAEPQSPRMLRELYGLLLEHGVLAFRGQRLTPEQQVAFSGQFGALEAHPLSEYCVDEGSQVLTVSNIVEDGRKVGLYEGDEVDWHVDHGTSPEPSAMSFLHSIIAPAEGGDTLFAAAHVAYLALPPAMRRRVEQLRAVHSMEHLLMLRRRGSEDGQPDDVEERRAAMPDVEHPLVRTHPVTGRRSLFVSQRTIRRVVGVEGDDEGRSLVEDLLAHATQPRFVYRHSWEEGDLVWWDNHTVIHSQSECDRRRFRRLLHRTTVLGSSL